MAVIVTVCVELTNRWVTANVALVAPLARFTDAGTVATFVFELLSVIFSPEEGAGPVKDNVPVTVV